MRMDDVVAAVMDVSFVFYLQDQATSLATGHSRDRNHTDKQEFEVKELDQNASEIEPHYQPC